MPNTREKLIELLGKCPCNYESEIKALGSCMDRKYGLCGEVAMLSYCTLQHLADHLIANGVTVQKRGRWVKHNFLGHEQWSCSECQTLGSPQWKCCPICETKMQQPPKEG